MAGSRAERGCKGEGTLTPVNTRVVAGQPRETGKDLKMGEGGKLEGKVFGVTCMNTKVGWEVVGYGSCRWTNAVN